MAFPLLIKGEYPSGCFSPTGTIGLVLWMNTIASDDQFKPIRIGENFLVNYHIDIKSK